MEADLLPVLVHIQASLDTDLSSAALALRAGMSESTLQRRLLDATGETPRRHVERLRLERAASQLLVWRGTILQIALDNGYASHEVFSRAFRRHFGLNPRDWRARHTAGGLGQHGREPGLSEAAPGATLSTTRLREMRPMRVAFLRHVGPYDEVDGTLWDRIRARLAVLGQSTDGLPLGLAHDDPLITAPERLRYDAGWTIERALPHDCGLGEQTVPGGTYAVTTYVGPFSAIGEAYAVIGERVMAHAHELEFGAGGAVEWYRTGSIDAESYLNQVDICFPMSARSAELRVLE